MKYEITEDSLFVLEFGLCSNEDLGSQGTNWEDGHVETGQQEAVCFEMME